MTLMAAISSSVDQAERVSIRAIPASQLTPELCARWDEVQRSNPSLASPYFRHEFTQNVAAIRSDVEVGLVEGPNGIEAFFPYQRSGRSAQPVAGRLSDFHGVISAPGFRCDPRVLLTGCGLSRWRFDHLLAAQLDFRPYMWTMADSPYIDLSQCGYQAYLAERKKQTSEIATAQRKLRNLERDVGTVRLEWQSTDRSALETLFRWKGKQYERTGLRDLFSFEWIRAVLTRLLDQDSPDLKGLLTCLYAGNRLVAAHLGMTSRQVLHWWFPAYDRELGKYSPGLGLILMMTEAAAAQGITRLDFGKGDEEYKFKLATGIDQVAEGCADLQLGSRLVRRTLQATRDWIRSSPLRGTVQAPLRWVRKWRDWLRFR